MKKMLLATLMLTLIVSTVYSNLRANAAATRARAVSNEMLSLMPNADFIVLIDVGQFLNTRFFSLIGNDAKAKEEFNKFEADALKYGIDIRQLREVAISGTNMGGKPGNVQAIVNGNFDREKMLAGIAAHPDRISMSSETYNNKTIYLLSENRSGKTSKSGGNDSPGLSRRGLPLPYNTDQFALSFLSSSQIVIGTLESVKQTLDVQVGKRPNLLANAQMSQYISSTNAAAPVRFAGVTPDKQKIEAAQGSQTKKPKVLGNEDINPESNGDQSASSSSSTSTSGEGPNPLGNIEKLFEAVRGAYGSLDFATGLRLDTTLLVRSEDEAKQISDSFIGLIQLGKMMIGGQAQQDAKQAKLLEVINQVNVSGQGKDVKIAIDLPEQLLKELFALLESEQKKTPVKKVQ
ncbi:MAG: hypothetical protein AB1489_20590 [Acidobacteriota bacterium]